MVIAFDKGLAKMPQDNFLKCLVSVHNQKDNHFTSTEQ